jgi:hypothetical protein
VSHASKAAGKRRARPPPALLEEREEIDAALDEQAADREADLLEALED